MGPFLMDQGWISTLPEPIQTFSTPSVEYSPIMLPPNTHIMIQWKDKTFVEESSTSSSFHNDCILWKSTLLGNGYLEINSCEKKERYIIIYFLNNSSNYYVNNILTLIFF